MKKSKEVSELLAIMSALRTPVTGCPWDLEQNFRTILPYTIEEAYEVADAIERNDMADLQDELGDLLLQVVFHAQMAKEQNLFDFHDVVESITGKLIRRHPHVFDRPDDVSPDAVKVGWDRIKAEEKAERQALRRKHGLADTEEDQSVLSGVPMPLPALTRAEKIQKKAAKVGFDWNDPRLVLTKIREETDEIDEALATGSKSAIEEEIGDLLFAVVNLARHLAIDPEDSLRKSNSKFVRRFNYIETELKKINKSPSEASLAEMDALWNDIRTKDKS